MFNETQIGVFIILKSIKNIFIHIRSSLKLVFLIIIASILVISIISLFYKITYSVSLNGEFVGYISDKVAMQEKINTYMEAIGKDNTAFIEINTLPEYSLCLVKREHETNDDEIFEKVTKLGTSYYEYYTILEGNDEKYYVATKEQAEEVIKKLTDKKSSNIKTISYKQVFGTEIKDFSETDSIVTALYKKPVVNYSSSYTIASSDVKMDLGISLIKPVSSGYTITSRYGSRWGRTHTGLDIASPTGTPIYAAASGTVTVVHYSNVSYGNYVKISHGNGVETLYAHCNTLNVTEGQSVSQGQFIATVGSTGNSTGSHLHLEIRKNGTTLNPQNYLY